MKSRIRLESILFFIAVVSSILSNFPVVLGTSLESLLKVMWALPFFYIFVVKNTRLLLAKKLLPVYALVITFFLYCFSCESVFGIKYIGADFNNIVISSLILITSFAYWKDNASEANIKHLSYLLLICGLILGLYAYFEYSLSNSILSKTYAVKQKNSIGQIIFCCALIPLLSIRNESRIIKFLVYVSVAVLTTIVFMIKSRATIVGIFFVIIYFIFKSGSTKTKIYSITFTIALVLFVLLNENLYNIVVNGILLAGRNIDNLNDVSSGRVILISKCWEGIFENFWFGNGNRYLDCMPIIMLYQYGAFGAIIVFSYLIYIGHYIFVKIDRAPVNLISFLLFSCFMLNSLFEAQPPFGPGIKCFLLWVFVGFSLAKPNWENTSNPQSIGK